MTNTLTEHLLFQCFYASCRPYAAFSQFCLSFMFGICHTYLCHWWLLQILDLKLMKT